MRLELPYRDDHITYFENCSFPLKRNILPNGVIAFSCSTEHKLEAFNPEGICECLQVLENEFDPSLYSPTSENDTQYRHLLRTDPIELRRYTSITVNGKIFNQLCEELVIEFSKVRVGVLSLHPISGDFALIFIKIFPTHLLALEDMLLRCG